MATLALGPIGAASGAGVGAMGRWASSGCMAALALGPGGAAPGGSGDAMALGGASAGWMGRWLHGCAGAGAWRRCIRMALHQGTEHGCKELALVAPRLLCLVALLSMAVEEPESPIDHGHRHVPHLLIPRSLGSGCHGSNWVC